MIRQFGSQKVSADFVIKDRLGGDITCNSGIGAMRRSKPPELVLYEIKRGETGSTPLSPPPLLPEVCVNTSICMLFDYVGL